MVGGDYAGIRSREMCTEAVCIPNDSFGAYIFSKDPELIKSFYRMSIVDFSLLQQRRHSRKRRVSTEPHYHCATRSRADYSVQLPGSWVPWTRRIALYSRFSYRTFTWLSPGERVKVKCGRISSKLRLRCHLVFTLPGFMLLCKGVTPWLSVREEHELRV